jgi:hypothetical protein
MDFELRLPSPNGRRVGDEGFCKMIFAGMLLPKFRPNKGQAALTKMAESIAKKGKVMNA